MICVETRFWIPFKISLMKVREKIIEEEGNLVVGQEMGGLGKGVKGKLSWLGYIEKRRRGTK